MKSMGARVRKRAKRLPARTGVDWDRLKLSGKGLLRYVTRLTIRPQVEQDVYYPTIDPEEMQKEGRLSLHRKWKLRHHSVVLMKMKILRLVRTHRKRYRYTGSPKITLCFVI